MVASFRNRALLIGLVLCGMVGAAITARAGDDTARFYGTWKISFQYNGQTVTVISVHDPNGYQNYAVTPTGNQPIGGGTFSAANGRWTSSAPAPNNGGTYRFTSATSAVCTNNAGQTVTWRREKAYQPPSSPEPGPSPAPSPQPLPAPATRQKADYYDPSVSPEINRASKALMQKDYNTAWQTFMAAAQRGDSDGEAGVGMMLFNHQNPPGTGYYAQAEKWLLASANQGNVHGMYYLGQYYNQVGRNLAGGINPGVNTNVSPYEQQQADQKYTLARKWFERASAKGDPYAKANLAIMLDAGIGGPRDPGRAAELRKEAAGGLDANYKKRSMQNPTEQAMKMNWQAGHYADALKIAQENAAKGDPASEGMLAKAYYEGVGVPRSFSQARYWAEKAHAKNDPEGTFILGLIYNNGAGVQQDRERALKLFDEAADHGEHYAAMEAKAIRMDKEVAKYAPKHDGVMDTACGVAGGTMAGFECIRGGSDIDPFAASQNEEN